VNSHNPAGQPIDGGERPRQIAALLQLVPSLAELISDFERPDPTVGLYIYCDPIWYDYVKPLLEEGRDIDPGFFTWLEELSSSDDNADRNLASAGFLEVFGDFPAWLKILRRSMGPATLRLSHETEVNWGREQSQ